MLTNDDKKWIVEIMDDCFDKQDKKIDAKFEEQSNRFDAKFAEQDKKIDAKFAEQDKRIDARFAEQDKRIATKFEEQDQRMGRFFINTEAELSEQAREHLRHIDVILENIWDRIAPSLEVIPGANKSYDMLERRMEAVETDCSILKQVVAEKSTA